MMSVSGPSRYLKHPAIRYILDHITMSWAGKGELKFS